MDCALQILAMKKWGFLFSLFFGVFGTATTVFAGALETLPEGINNVSFRSANIEGIGQRYTEDGTLMTLGDYRSVHFTSQNLSRLNAKAQKLIQALDRFGTQEAGTNINFGVFKVETTPQVSFSAPVYARGITKNWTVGVAIPVVNYKNQISFVNSGSNLDMYRAQLTGINSELDEALNTDLIQEARNTFRERGYRELDSRNETFLADIQVASLYNFYQTADVTAQYQMMVTLPTGPVYNTDDLAALNAFGRTAVDNRVSVSYILPQMKKLEVVPFASVMVTMPDRVVVRVPKDEYDAIPDQTTKERLDRQVGLSMSLGGDLFYSYSDAITFSTGYAMAVKAKDEYAGTEGRRYDLLGKNTDSMAHRVSVGVSYSSVKDYFKRKAILPGVVSLALSDTIWGRNVERRTMQELNLMMFF